MKLEQSDAELFYQLWFPLLDFVNRKHHVCPETETIGQRKGIDARNAKKTLGCLLLYAARFDAYSNFTFSASIHRSNFFNLLIFFVFLNTHYLSSRELEI